MNLINFFVFVFLAYGFVDRFKINRGLNILYQRAQKEPSYQWHQLKTWLFWTTSSPSMYLQVYLHHEVHKHIGTNAANGKC